MPHIAKMSKNVIYFKHRKTGEYEKEKVPI